MVFINMSNLFKKNNKVPSFDLVCNKHIKLGGYSLIESLTVLFNNIIKQGKFPRYSKLGMIIPVYKDNGKSNADPINYRTIILLPCIFKLFEKLIHELLTGL